MSPSWDKNGTETATQKSSRHLKIGILLQHNFTILFTIKSLLRVHESYNLKSACPVEY